ncbi:MAG: hypothetical protein AAF171_23475 [Cyanobacteria bacterium P01_A01_bin.116]|mgnify:CR=1 FL=1
MRKIEWIVCNQSHRAVITSAGGYINLVAKNRGYTIEFISDKGLEPIVYSSSAKNLRHAKALSVADGYALLKELGYRRSRRKPTYGRVDSQKWQRMVTA